MTDQVTGVTHWHINADEPSVLDYEMDYKSPNQHALLYSSDAYRASDHNPVAVGLRLWADCSTAKPSIESIWPPNHKFVDVMACSPLFPYPACVHCRDRVQ